jgi:hypothetical protein
MEAARCISPSGSDDGLLSQRVQQDIELKRNDTRSLKRIESAPKLVQFGLKAHERLSRAGPRVLAELTQCSQKVVDQ